MFLRLLVALVLWPLAADADCRHLLDIGPGAISTQPSQPFRRELQHRLEAYDAVTTEVFRAHTDVVRLRTALEEQSARVSWIERIVLERRAWPLTKRADELMRRHIAHLEAGRAAETATARLRDMRASLEAFVLETFARADERVRELVLARQDLDHALKLARECRDQIDRAQACAARRDFILAHEPTFVSDFYFQDDLGPELATLNRALIAVGAPAHNLGVRPGWSLPTANPGPFLDTRLARLRKLVAALEAELANLRADFEARLAPLVEEALCRDDACSF